MCKKSGNLKILLLPFLFLALVLLFVKITSSNPHKVETRGYEALYRMRTYGIIENEENLKQIIEETNYGRDITKLSDLSLALSKINRYSSAWILSGEPDEKELRENSLMLLPEKEKMKDYWVIKVPSIRSYMVDDTVLYSETLAKFIEETGDAPLVLDIRENPGGDMVPMILGVSGLIPDGVLFYEIDRFGNRFPIYLDKNLVVGGPSKDNSYTVHSKEMNLPIQKKKLNKKVAVITDSSTISAAEYTVLALKQNKNVKIFGQATIGATSFNQAFNFKRDGDPNVWITNMTASYIETAPRNSKEEKKVYNNSPIEPDVKVEDTRLDESNQEMMSALKDWFEGRNGE